MQIIARATVPAITEPERFDRMAQQLLPSLATRSAARKAIKRAEVLLDGREESPSRWVNPGQEITQVEPAGRVAPVFPMRHLRVLHDDDHVAVVEKPPGLRVNGPQFNTLEHALPAFLAPSAAPDALRRPRPAHRLDAPTGGLVAIGKTGRGLAGLSEAFHQRLVRKRYQAIAVGRLDGEGVVTTDIDERAAETRWRAVEHAQALKSDWVTRVDLVPVTGRTHQLRRHLHSLGHPILGDNLYFREGLLYRGKGLFLWAVELELPHPVLVDPLHVRIDPPAKFTSFLAREQRRWNKWHGASASTPGGD